MRRSVEDLFSDHIDLFLPCPNSRAEEQSDEAIYVPNPKYRESGDALSMWRILFRLTRRYTFGGNLIGISLRTKQLMSIELCSAEIGRQAAVLLLDRINGLEAPRVVRKFAPRLVPPEEYGRRILRGRINAPEKQGEWNA